MRISDWSSDVCSSDEQLGFGHRHVAIFERQRELTAVDLFRSLAEVHAVENIKKVLEPGGAEPFGDDHRLQCLDVVGQLFHPLAHGADRYILSRFSARFLRPDESDWKSTRLN